MYPLLGEFIFRSMDCENLRRIRESFVSSSFFSFLLNSKCFVRRRNGVRWLQCVLVWYKFITSIKCSSLHSGFEILNGCAGTKFRSRDRIHISYSTDPLNQTVCQLGTPIYSTVQYSHFPSTVLSSTARNKLRRGFPRWEFIFIFLYVVQGISQVRVVPKTNVEIAKDTQAWQKGPTKVSFCSQHCNISILLPRVEVFFFFFFFGVCH